MKIKRLTVFGDGEEVEQEDHQRLVGALSRDVQRCRAEKAVHCRRRRLISRFLGGMSSRILGELAISHVLWYM